jgi:hypothetical protein
MHKNISDLIQAFDTALLDAGYKRSSFTGSLFYEASNFLDNTYCIQALSSTISSFDERGNWQPSASWSGEWRSTLEIEILNKLRLDAHNADYISKLNSDEETFFRTIVSTTKTGFKFFPRNVTRSLTSDRQFLSTKYTIEVIHRFTYGV